MMVDASVNSVLAQFEDEDAVNFDTRQPQRTASRFASGKREQPSRNRLAMQSRYSRRSSAGAPKGPRRRFRKG